MMTRNIILISVVISVAIAGIMIGLNPFSNNDKNIIEGSIIDRMNTIQIGNPNENLLSVSVTEKILVKGTVDSIQILRILPQNTNLVSLASMEPSKFVFEITDQNQNDIVDRSQYLGPSFREGQFLINAKCNSVEKNAYFISPESVPLVSFESPVILIKYADYGIQADSNETYRISFWSLYETELELPSNYVVTSTKKETCSVFYENFKNVFYYEMEFKKQN
jgi:hypothetical protein